MTEKVVYVEAAYMVVCYQEAVLTTLILRINIMYKRLILLISILIFASLAAVPAVAEPNLVACWNFDDSTADDSSGNAHDGTVIGDVNFYDDPERGMVGNFPGGSGNYINCGGGGGGTWADITDEITVMAWVKTDGYTIAYQYVGAKESSWRISRYSTTDQLRWYNTGMVPSSLYGTNNIQDGEWHHVAGVYNGSNRYLYIDGDVDASDAETGSLGTNTFAVTIGGTLRADSLARTWVGQIDDFRIYDRGLSETEIRVLAEWTYTISGTITDASQNALEGVTMSGLPGSPTPTTDANGFYSATVVYDWSGTVTPSEPAYTFSPLSRQYNNVSANQTSQDYTATLIIVDPNLIGWWNFDDSTANDSSGYAHHGTFVGGANAVYDSDRDSNVLELSSTAEPNEYVNCGGGKDVNDPNTWADIRDAITVMAWVKIDAFTEDYQYIACKEDTWRLSRVADSNHVRMYNSGMSPTNLYGDNNIQDNQWHHVAGVYDGSTRRLYIDGELDATDPETGSLTNTTYEIWIGSNPPNAHRVWNGRIDDVKIYDRGMSWEEIRDIAGAHIAYDPEPFDGARNEPTASVTLSWKPGNMVADTNGHEIYFGTSFDDVNDGNSAVYIGAQDGNSYTVTSLTTLTTYYWVVDEVNGANTWYGKVWSFKTRGDDYISDEGFYKDLFMDGGDNLTSRTSLPAAELLGLSMEYLATGDANLTLKIMVETDDGSWDDDNGALLYPDGEPRFRHFYSNGGDSIAHGATLGEDGRQRIRDFYANGGGYSGSCAGSALPTIRVTTTSTNTTYREEYYHIWPARGHYTQLAASDTGHDIPEDSPLLDYYDFGGDNYVASVRHNGGNYTIEDDAYFWCTGTEVLATFAEPIVGDDESYQPFMGNVSAWAYKDDGESGRLAVCGSHPESITSGERRDFQAAMFAYGMDGIGSPTVKAALTDGVTRTMNDNSSSGHEKIGDLQYHHFTIDVPADTGSLAVTLDGDDSYNLDLFAMKGGFAFNDDPNVTKATNGSGADETITIDSPDAGTWYIGVKCTTVVTGSQEGTHFACTGNLGVLNGVSYTITADSDESGGDSNVPDPNLVAWYTFDNDDASDSSGYDHDGTLVGSDVSIVTDSDRGKVLNLDNEGDAINSYLNAGGAGDWADIRDKLTVAAWIKIDNLHTTNMYMLTKGNTYQITSNGTADGLRAYMTGLSDTTLTTGTTTDDAKWHHFVVTYDSVAQEREMYIDGAQVATDTPSGLLNVHTEPLVIGGRSNTSYDHRGFDGRMDDVRVYNRILSEREILNLSRLVARYTFDDEDATDSSGNAHDGTVIGDVNFYDDAERDVVGNFPGGTGNYINCGGGGGGTWADITDEITVMAWVKTDGYTIAYQYVGAKESSWRISRYSTTDHLRWYNTGMVPSSLYGTNDIQDGEWHHVAGVYNGSNRYLYIDGDADASDAETGSLGTNTFAVTIGGTLRADSLARTWVGQIDDFRIYDKGLTETQIEAIINATN